MTKEIVNIFVSHGSWKSEGKECLREAFDALERVVEEFNKVIDYRDHFEIRLSDFQKNPNATYQSLEELMKNADKFHAVFVLVEGQLSPAIKDWYIEKEKILKETKEEQRVPIPVFWDISNDSSAKNFEEFCKENQKERNYIHSYRTPDERDEELRKTLKKYAVDWNQKIIKGEILPTMEENRRKAEEERRRHRRNVILGFIGAVFFFAVAYLAVYKLWPNFKPNPNRAGKPGQEQPIPEPYRNDLEKRISNAEVLVAKKKYQQAIDSLNAIKAKCPSDYIDLVYKVDSMMKALPPMVPDKQHIPSQKVILENGYSIEPVNIDNDFLTNISSLIKSKSGIPLYEGNNVLWTVSISETRSERGVVYGDYYVDLSVSVLIKNNTTEEKIPLTTFERKSVKSSISYVDAYKEAHDEALAEQVADGIINIINYEK